MTDEIERSEAERIERVYATYGSDPAARRRWSLDDPGNASIEHERDNEAQAVLGAAGLLPIIGRTLDLGCGDGRMLTRLREWGASRTDVVGVDLLADRLDEASRSVEGALLVRTNGMRLPFADGTFRLVVLFTVFSSILEEPSAWAVAREVDRVLDPRGSVLWYDIRVGNPMNPHTRAVPREEIARYFPSYRIRLKRITLLPQLARRLGFLTPFVYPVLSRLPFLQTHYVGVLNKLTGPEPSAGS